MLVARSGRSVIALIRVQFWCPSGRTIDAEMIMKNSVMNEDVAGMVLLSDSDLVEVAGGGGLALTLDFMVDAIGPTWPKPK